VYRFELRPNSSLTPRAAAFFYLSIAAMSLGIAGGFAWLGFWPVLPFAGLELAGLGAAFWITQRRAGVREFVQVDEHRVTFRREGLGQKLEREFHRPWVRVEMRRAPVAHWPSRLLLAAHGRSVEVGAFLTEDERIALKARLGGVLGDEANRR
jgi:uncharacterized membrane protein